MQQTIKQVCEELTEFLLAKNKAYGDSASDPVRIFSKTDPLEQINIRIDDKLSRIARGNEFDGDDTELDLIGYLVLKRAIKRRKDARRQEDVEVYAGREETTATGYRDVRAVPGVPLDMDVLRKAYPYDPEVRTIILVPAARRAEVLALKGATERSGTWGITPPENVFTAASHLLFGYLPGEPVPEEYTLIATAKECGAEVTDFFDYAAGEDMVIFHNVAELQTFVDRIAVRRDAIAELKKSAAQLSPGIIVRRGVSTVPLTEGMTMKESAEYFVEQTLRREAPGRSGYQGIAMVIDPAGKEPSWFVRGDVAVKCGSSFTLPPIEQYCDEAEPAQEPACPHANTKDIDPAKSYGYTKFCTDCGEPLDRVGYCPTTPTAGRLA